MFVGGGGSGSSNDLGFVIGDSVLDEYVYDLYLDGFININYIFDVIILSIVIDGIMVIVGVIVWLDI